MHMGQMSAVTSTGALFVTHAVWCCCLVLRACVLCAYHNYPALQVLLVSTRAGGTGLNLTEAAHAFMMDCWWNAAVDEQAMDRVHRLGQTRPVTVIRCVPHATGTRVRVLWPGGAARRT
jgi:hypothetical protein